MCQNGWINARKRIECLVCFLSSFGKISNGPVNHLLPFFLLCHKATQSNQIKLFYKIMYNLKKLIFRNISP